MSLFTNLFQINEQDASKEKTETMIECIETLKSRTTKVKSLVRFFENPSTVQDEAASRQKAVYIDDLSGLVKSQLKKIEEDYGIAHVKKKGSKLKHETNVLRDISNDSFIENLESRNDTITTGFAEDILTSISECLENSKESVTQENPVEQNLSSEKLSGSSDRTELFNVVETIEQVNSIVNHGHNTNCNKRENIVAQTKETVSEINSNYGDSEFRDNSLSKIDDISIERLCINYQDSSTKCLDIETSIFEAESIDVEYRNSSEASSASLGTRSSDVSIIEPPNPCSSSKLLKEQEKTYKRYAFDEDVDLDRIVSIEDSTQNASTIAISSPKFYKVEEYRRSVDRKFVANSYESESHDATQHENILRNKRSINLNNNFSTSNEFQKKGENIFNSLAISFSPVEIENKENIDFDESGFLRDALGSNYNCDRSQLNDSFTQTDTDARQKEQDDTFSGLRHKIDCQSILMIQSYKALELCKGSRKFHMSLELVEAEKILLVAAYKLDLLKYEIQETLYEGNSLSVPTPTTTAVINNISVPLNVKDTNCLYYFVGILSCGSHVIATKAIEPSNGNVVAFTDEYTFSGVPADSVIKLQIYSLKLKKKDRMATFRDHMAIFSSCKKKQKRCSRKTLFYRDNTPVFTVREASIPMSSFQFEGGVKIELKDGVTHSQATEEPVSIILGDKIKYTLKIDEPPDA